MSMLGHHDITSSSIGLYYYAEKPREQLTAGSAGEQNLPEMYHDEQQLVSGAGRCHENNVHRRASS